MAGEKESQRGSLIEMLPRPRIQALSDLIFGLALSIGALTLLSQKPSSAIGLLGSLLGFGFAFLILALVWVRYTRIMSVLPVENGTMLGANMLLLFLVSIEPFLFNLLVSFSSATGQLDTGTASVAYATDMGLIFLIIAYFSHELTREERKLIPKELLRTYKLQRDTTIVTAALFFVSALPIFWSLTVLGLPVRFVFWMGSFATWAIRRVVERKREPSGSDSPASQNEPGPKQE